LVLAWPANRHRCPYGARGEGMESGREQTTGHHDEPVDHGLECSVCGETHDEGYLHSRCHPDAPMWLKLSPDGATVQCAECEDALFTLRVVGTHHGGLDVVVAALGGEFRPSTVELGVLASHHLDRVRLAEFTQEVSGRSCLCKCCYGKRCSRLADIKRILGDDEYAAATKGVEDEWAERFAEKQFYKQCEKCGCWAIDTRLDEGCMACGHGAPHERVA